MTRLPRQLRLFLALNIALYVLCLGLMLFWRRVLQWHYPYSYPFLPVGFGRDFLVFRERFQHFHSGRFFADGMDFPFSYPAPAALIYEAFYATGRVAQGLYVGVAAGAVAALAVVLARAMQATGVRRRTAFLFAFGTMAASGPLMFVLLQGNIEIYVFLLTAAGILLLLRGRGLAAAVLLGVTASMKLFPAVYLALFLFRRQYRLFFVGLAVAVATNEMSLWLVCPSLGESSRGIRAGLDTFRQVYLLPYREIDGSFDHSIFGFAKRVAHGFGVDVMPGHALTFYLGLMALTGLAVCVFLRKLPELNQILSLCLMSLLFTPMSHEYTLLYLYVPWGLLVVHTLKADQASDSLRGVVAAFVCFAMVFSPLGDIILWHTSVSGQVKALTMLALLGIALSFRWPPSGNLRQAESTQGL